MRFALIDNKKVEAKFGLEGICPGCSQPVIAKCGKQRVHHWAHSRSVMCDTWWEPETEWHRVWKNNYPTDWQEVIIPDEKTGEKHIADVRTAHSLVIEFQHSHIDPKEQATRERFYQNMVWVVDGTRLKRDYPRFLKGRNDFRNTKKQGVFLVDYPEESFPSAWLESSVPVVFDFRGLETIDNISDLRNRLYCLLSIRTGRYAILAEIPRKAFITTSITGDWSLRVRNFIENLIHPKQEQQNQITEQQMPQANNTIRRREPQWFFERGKWKRRKRF